MIYIKPAQQKVEVKMNLDLDQSCSEALNLIMWKQSKLLQCI